MREITEHPNISGGVVLSWSGGKDSAATAIALIDAGISFAAVCADTGWEAAQWYDHLEAMRSRVPGGIELIRAEVELPADAVELATWVEELLPPSACPSPMVRLLLRKASYPASQSRWCSAYLKHDPLDEWVMENAPDAVHATGVRAEESPRRAALEPTEVYRKTGQMHWRPILRWTLEDVLEAHRHAGWPLCPLYDLGPERVGCWPCIPARAKAELHAVRLDPQRVACIRRIEEAVSILRKARGMPGEDAVDGRAGAFLIADPMSHGTLSRTIDQALAWAATTRGGRQMPMFEAPSDTCSRWGFCESPKKIA